MSARFAASSAARIAARIELLEVHGRERFPTRLAMLDHDVGEDAAPYVPLGSQAQEARRDGAHDVVDDLIGDGFMEGALVAEAPGIELQAFQFDTKLVGDVVDNQHREIRLAGQRAQAGEFGHLDMDLEIPLLAGIGEGIEGLGGLRRHDAEWGPDGMVTMGGCTVQQAGRDSRPCVWPFGIIRSARVLYAFSVAPHSCPQSVVRSSIPLQEARFR